MFNEGKELFKDEEIRRKYLALACNYLLSTPPSNGGLKRAISPDGKFCTKLACQWLSDDMMISLSLFKVFLFKNISIIYF